MVEAREANANHAPSTLIPLNPPSMSFSPLLDCRLQKTGSLYLLISTAFGALWLVAPGKEVLFEPLQKSLKLGNLVCDLLDLRRDHADH